MQGHHSLDAPARKSARRQASDTRTINLALQGGGSHGAFTWGVLDRLMRDKRIEHKRFISEHGEDMPEVRDWKWPY